MLQVTSALSSPAPETKIGLKLEGQYRKEGFSSDSDGKESAFNAENLGLIPELGRSPGEGNGNPLRYSCLGNS